MKNLLGTIGFFVFICGGMALAEFVGEHFATEAGVILLVATFYGLYRAGRFFWNMR